MPGWAKLPLDLFAEYDLSCTAACIYAVLLDISDKHDPAGIGYYTAQCRQRYICDKLGITRQTVIRCLAELDKHGLVQQDRTGRASIYIIRNLNV